MKLLTCHTAQRIRWRTRMGHRSRHICTQSVASIPSWTLPPNMFCRPLDGHRTIGEVRLQRRRCLLPAAMCHEDLIVADGSSFSPTLFGALHANPPPRFFFLHGFWQWRVCLRRSAGTRWCCGTAPRLVTGTRGCLQPPLHLFVFLTCSSPLQQPHGQPRPPDSPLP